MIIKKACLLLWMPYRSNIQLERKKCMALFSKQLLIYVLALLGSLYAVGGQRDDDGYVYNKIKIIKQKIWT